MPMEAFLFNIRGLNVLIRWAETSALGPNTGA